MSRACSRCGSAKIIPNLALPDHYGDLGHISSPAEVKVHGDPSAWFLKDTSSGKLLLDVCGDCGHADLRVANFRELYEKHLQASRAHP